MNIELKRGRKPLSENEKERREMSVKGKTYTVSERNIHSYASGVGGIDFDWIERRIHRNGSQEMISVGTPTLTEILRSDAWEELKKRGFLIGLFPIGRPLAFEPCDRIGENRIRYHGHEFEFAEDVCTKKRVFYVREDNGDLLEMKHISSIAAMNFFLDNEKFIHTLTGDFQI